MTVVRGLDRQTIDLPSGSVSYLAGGTATGTTCLLLHGGGADSAELSWSDTVPALIGAGYRIYAPDHPGFGCTPLPERPITTEHLVEYVDEFVTALGLERFMLCGISMGGAMAIGLTLRRNEIVARLVLIGTYGIQHRSPAHALSYLAVRVPGAAAATTLLGRSRWLLRRSLGLILRDHSRITPDLVAAVRRSLLHSDAPRAYSQWQRSELKRTGTRTDYTDRLAEIVQPTMIAHDSCDVGVPLADAERAAELIRDAQLAVFHGAGHWTQRDQPERFNATLLDFLAGRAEPTGSP